MQTFTVSAAGFAAVFLLAATLGACSGGNLWGSLRPLGSSPASSSASPAALSPPPVELAGAWQLSAGAGGTCVMNFAEGSAAGSRPGAPAAAPTAPPGQGTIAPEGGCPGNFFTSRHWTFERGMLVIRDFKDRPLAQLSYSGGDFQGQDAKLGPLTLSKQM